MPYVTDAHVGFLALQSKHACTWLHVSAGGKDVRCVCSVTRGGWSIVWAAHLVLQAPARLLKKLLNLCLGRLAVHGEHSHFAPWGGAHTVELRSLSEPVRILDVAVLTLSAPWLRL